MRYVSFLTVLLITACAAPEPPSAGLEEAQGGLIAAPGEIRLCEAMAESYPPQCAGQSVLLEGISLEEVVGLTRPPEEGIEVVWSDFSLTVRGTTRGEVFSVVEVAQQVGQAVEGDLRLRFAPHPVPLRSGGQVTWALDLTNLGSDPVVAEYNPALPAEVVLVRDGEEVYRFTEGKVFTQSLQSRALPPGVPVGFVLHDELTLEPGTYTAIAVFQGSPAGVPPVEVTVTVEG